MFFVVVIGLWLVSRNAAALSDAATTTTDAGGQYAPSDFLAGVVDTVNNTISNITTSVPDALGNSNVQAFLQLIRTGEGTLGPAGYSMLFGKKQFQGFADHPRVHIPFGTTTTTAAGAYQILEGTWDEMQNQYSLPDFSPASQDTAAVGLIKRRGALADVIAGRFASAISKCNKEWASLPNSPYGQPTLSMSDASFILAANGAQVTEVMA